jgi:hypothetical protein
MRQGVENRIGGRCHEQWLGSPHALIPIVGPQCNAARARVARKVA